MPGKYDDYVVSLKSKDAAERWRAAGALTLVARDLPGGVLEYLKGALGDSHPFVRWQAGLALASAGRDRGLPLLVRALRDEGDVGRAAAVDALAVMPDAAAWQEVASLLKSADPTVRQSCAEALGRIGAVESAGHLVDALKDESKWVRRAAARALGHVGNEGAFLPLCERLVDGNEAAFVRRSAAYALGALRASPALSYLVRAIDDPDPQVRLNAAWALGRIENRDALPALRRLAEDDALDGMVAEAARRAVSNIQPSLLRRLLGLFGGGRR